MSVRQSRIAWGVVLAACLGLCAGLSVGQAQRADTPSVEKLLPANSVIYWGWDGNDAHQPAWEQTAAYDALYKSGMMDALGKLVALVPPNQEVDVSQVIGLYQQVSGRGLSLAVSGSIEQGPSVQATLVLHQSAALEPGLSDFVRKATQGEIDFATRTIEGRKVTQGLIPNSPGIEVGWWTEGENLVVVAGLQAVENGLGVAAGRLPNLGTNELWKKYRQGQTDFEVTSVGWLDFGALRRMFGDMPIPNPPGDRPLTVNQVLQAAGLDTMGALVCRSGYKGRAMWSQTTLEAPGPKRGLLALCDQPTIRLEDLPPLPFGVNGFYATGIDWSKLYDNLTQLAADVAVLGPPDAAAQLEGLIAAAPDLLGFDLKADLFDSLGNVTCLYGDTRQSFFGLGTGLVIEVKDAEKLRAGVDKMLAAIVERSEGNVAVRRANKQGREIYMIQAAGVTSLSLAVDDGWLVLGMLPQTVEAFLLRVDQKLTNWTPTPSYQAALQAMPQEFSSIRATDPRKTYRSLIGLAPVLMSFAETGLRQSGLFPPSVELPLSLADIPPAEQFTRPLFPNLTTSTVDEDGIHWTSRTSLPSIPLVGGMGGGSTVAVGAIGVALLLPAVQQAREAARRSQSRNNLKQIGLALHNYHDVHRHFPQGTHPNDKLKPEQRLSWQASVLPFIDQAPLFNQIKFGQGWSDKENEKWMKTVLPVLIHPNVPHDPTDDKGFAVTHYVGIAGVGKDAPLLKKVDKKAGVFGYNRVTRMQDISDGTSNTVAVSEASKDFGPWGAGGKATIRALTEQPYINGPDGIGSFSRGGCNMLFADGSVRFISENIDPATLEALTTIAGGEIIGQIP